MSSGSDDAPERTPEEPFGPVEPDEFDPADRWGSPEHDLVPQAPAPSTAPEDVDRDLAQTWWTSVLLANVALGAPAVGLMLIYFRGQWQLGGGAVLVGVVAAVALVRSIRAFRRRRGTDDGGAESESAPDDNA